MGEKRILVDKRHTFEIVDFIPDGYLIWNIGKNMVDGWLPICRLCKHQPWEEARRVEDLKAIRTDGAQTILAAIGGGQDTIPKMERYIKRYKNAKPGTWCYRQVQRMKAALPYMRELKWGDGQ